MGSVKRGSKLYSVSMFLLVSALCGVLTAGLALPFVALTGGFAKTAAESLDYLPAELEIKPTASKSKVLMADGSVLAEFFDENRVPVTLDQIAPIMQQAQIDIEDHRFYEHGAIDVVGTLRALTSNAFGGETQGGSTLTQQYVKQVRIETAKLNNDERGVYKAQEPTMSRKIIEARYAIALEKKLTKDEILERYLNIAYYGDGAYGVESAARHYFSTTAAELTLPQAAMLAGIVQNPNTYNPVANPRAAVERRNQVLNTMQARGSITAEECEAAKAEPWTSSKVTKFENGCKKSPYPFVCQYVEKTLIHGDILGGATPKENRDLLYRGGYTIQTLIDPVAQDEAEKAVADLIDPRDPVLGTVVLLESQTGMIISMAQSRPKMGTNEGETFYNYNVSEKMGGAEGYQAGSTFKIYTIAAGLEKGMTPAQRYTASSPMSFTGTTWKSCSGNFKLSEKYVVKNSVGHSTNIDMMEAAQWSVNTYFMQLERDVGLCETVKMAQRVGAERADGKDFIKDKPYFDIVPSFTLGTVEVTPLSLTRSYATFANRGTNCEPIILKSVTTRDGTELPVPDGNCTSVVAPEIADGVNYILKSVVEKGTGRPAKISGQYDMAGKTGTTDDAQAVWFAGYTPEVTGVAMLAIDKTHPYWETHRKSLSGLRLPYSGRSLSGSGSGDAGKIFKQAMSKALPRYTPTKFTPPSKEVLEGKSLKIPSISGMNYNEAKAAVQEAGFTTQDWWVPSDRPKGTFLGLSKSGEAKVGTVIYLKLSTGEPEPPPEPEPEPAPEDPAPAETPR